MASVDSKVTEASPDSDLLFSISPVFKAIGETRFWIFPSSFAKRLPSSSAQSA